MKKLLALLLALMLAFSTLPLLACGGGSEGNGGGNEGGSGQVTPSGEDPEGQEPEGEDPIPHNVHDFNVEWDWDNLDDNGVPAPVLSCKIRGCDATESALKTAFSGKTKGIYKIITYTVLDTENLPTVNEKGKGFTCVAAQKKTGTDKSLYFEDRHYGDINEVIPQYLVQDKVKTYLTAQTSAEQFAALNNGNVQGCDTQKNYSIKPNVIVSDATFSVYDITNGFNGKTLVEPSKTTVPSTYTYKDYVPTHTYYWETVKDNKVIESGIVKFGDDVTTKIITVSGVRNFRDLGGWTMGDGNKIPYGLIYRCGKMEGILDAGKETVKALGIKNELDLRCLGTSTPPVNPNIPGVNYYKYYTSRQYEGLINGTTTALATSVTTSGITETGTPIGKYNNDMRTHGDAYKDIFTILADKNNYPLVFNCSGGADRTGTLAFLIEGLLGVAEEDLIRDFELTSFSDTTRWRSSGNYGDFDDSGEMTNPSYVHYGTMVNTIKNQFAGDTLAKKIETFLKTKVGVTAEQIQSIKTIFGYTL